MKMTVAQVLVRFLKEAGVRHIFGVSGHSIFDLTDAIYLEPGIDLVSAQIEIAAAYMASAHSRALRAPSACLASAGAGATNLVTGVAQAFKESAPVLVISSDVDSQFAGKGASSWHEVPQEEIFRPITRMSLTLKHPDDVLSGLRQCLDAATTRRSGPVYLGIPRDFQLEEVEVPPTPWVDGTTRPVAPDAALVQRAAVELASATAPTIIVGGGVHWAGCEAEVRNLAELLNAPFGTTPSHKGLISEAHPLSLGVLGFGAFPFANAACRESDVILAIGTTFSEALTLGYGDKVISSGARIIHVDTDPAEIGKSYPVRVGVVGDAKAFIAALLARLRAGARSASSASRVERIQAEKAAWQGELARRGAPSAGPITQWHLYHALHEALGEDTLVVAEGGTGELSNRFVATAPVYSGGDFRPIGHGLATAIGLQYAFPERRVACVSGDGSFMMELQELATATRDGLPIVCVVVHNDAYGNMKRDQIRHYAGRVIGTELNVPDLCTLGTAFGTHVERVDQPSQLADAISSALAARKTALLDVVCPIEGI